MKSGRAAAVGAAALLLASADCATTSPPDPGATVQRYLELLAAERDSAAIDVTPQPAILPAIDIEDAEPVDTPSLLD